MNITSISIEEARKIAKEKGYTLLSNSIKKVTDKVDFNCDKHGVFTTQFRVVKDGHKCPECAKELSRKRMANSIDYVRRFIESKGYKLISTSYSKNTDKLVITCPIHGEFIRTFNCFQKSPRCPVCSINDEKKKKMLPIDEVRDRFLKHDCVLISDTYNGESDKLAFICNKHKDKGVQYSTVQMLRSYDNCCHFCGKEKKRIKQLAGNGHRWRGGTTGLQKYLRRITKPWAKEIYKKNNYKCEVTGISGKLNVHHFVSFRCIVDKTLDDLGLDIKQNIGDYTQEEISNIVARFKENNSKLSDPIVMLESIHRRFHQFCGGCSAPTSYEQLEQFRKMLREEQEKKAG